MTQDAASSRVSIDEVRHVSELANLELTGEELPRMVRDLDAILGYIDQLNELDTRDVLPMAQPAEAFVPEEASSGEALRRDELRPSTNRATIMDEAPQTDGRFFKVPKVIER